MSLFNETGYVLVRGALGKQTTKLLETNFLMVKDIAYHTDNSAPNKTHTGDGQVNNAFSWYGVLCFESLLVNMQPVVQDITNKELLPCYSYARIMYAGAEMLKHKDRPSCEYSVTICISEDLNNPYPIFMEGHDGEATAIHLAPGDMLVYKGTELNHWREAYKGAGQMQAFLHYVDAHGPYKHKKFDARPILGLPGIPN
jgi:hypothetical protein